MDQGRRDYADFYYEFKLKNPTLTRDEIEAEYLKLEAQPFKFDLKQNVDDEAFPSFFKFPYHDPWGTLQHLYDYICDIQRKWDPEEYYSPYFSIVQRSSMGKSRSICQLTSLGVYVVYVNLLKTQKGYPLRTPIIADKFEAVKSAKEAEQVYLCFIIAALEAVGYTIHHKISAVEFLRSHIAFTADSLSTTAFWRGFWDRMIQIQSKITNNTTYFDISQMVQDCTDNLGKSDNCNHNWIAKLFETKTLPINTRQSMKEEWLPFDSGASSDYSTLPSVKVIFAFDEIRALLPSSRDFNGIFEEGLPDKKRKLANNKSVPVVTGIYKSNSESEEFFEGKFTALRRALRRLPVGSPVVAVMLDTTSRVGNVARPAWNDYTQKVVVEGKRLFEPFCLLSLMDVNPEVHNYVGKNLSYVLRASFISCFGCPLWSARIKEEKPNSLISLAKQKLCGGGGSVSELLFKQLKEPTGGAVLDNSLLQTLTIVGSRLSFHILRNDIASELVASFMRTCLYIAPDRYSLITGQPSEPILSEAAAQLIYVGDNEKRMLKLLITSIRSGCINAGENGELAARYILLKAKDEALLKYYRSQNMIIHQVEFPFSKAITVEIFLESLLGKHNAEGILIRADHLSNKTGLRSLRQGKIHFTHFSEVTYIPTPKELLRLLSRGCAVQCKVGQPGIDQIIIILLPDENGEYIMNADNITYILIQDKNISGRMRDKAYRTNATAAASAYYSNLDLVPGNIYISLYLSFGGGLLKRVSCDYPFEPNTKEVCFRVESKKGKNVVLTRHSEHNLSNNNLSSIVKSVLKRGKVSDDEWKKRLRKARYHLQNNGDITHLEMIRKSYQVSFAVFGVNESVYPCLARNNDNDNVIEAVSSTRTSGRMVLRRISASPSLKRKKLSKKTEYNELVNLMRQLILAKADPIQSYNNEVDKEKVREIMIPRYRTKKEKVLATDELKEMFENLDISEEDGWEHDVYGEGVYEIDEDSDVSNPEEDDSL